MSSDHRPAAFIRFTSACLIKRLVSLARLVTGSFESEQISVYLVDDFVFVC